MKTPLNTALILLGFVLLTACDGGGGGETPPADTTAPVITLNGTNPVDIDANTTYVDSGATASDNLDGDITANIITTSTVDTSTVGTYSVTYNVSDAAGNTATPVVRTVNVTDNSFNIGTGMNDGVWSIAPATDGSGDVYVGGQFTTINGVTHNHSARMNSDGTVDTDFYIGTGMNYYVHSITPATDGSGDVYVGGAFTTVNDVTYNRLVRLNSDGSVDTGFNLGLGMNGFVYSIAPATDGSGDIYVGGQFTTINGITSNFLVRLNSDGSVDTGFNIGTGMVSWVRTIAPATDGSGDVYVGGDFYIFNGVSANRLVRLNSDGSVDTGFNIGTGMNNNWVNTIAPATDGSGDVYVGGAFTSVNGIAYNRLVRMNNDGTVDTGFNIGTGMNSDVRSIVPATDGSGDVYVGGDFTTVNDVTYNRLVRLNSDGSVDTGFNIGTGMNNDVNITALATDGSGDIYVGGHFTTVNTITSNYLVGINPDGSVE